jgi:hypothetical protein
VVGSIYAGKPSAFSDPQWRLKVNPTTLRQAEQKFGDMAFELCGHFAEEKAAKAANQLSATKIRELLSQASDWALAFTENHRMINQFGPEAILGELYGSFNSASYDLWHLVLLLETSIWAHDHIERLTDELGGRQSNGEESQGRLPAPFFETQGADWRDEIYGKILRALEFTTQAQMGLYGAEVSVFPTLVLLQRIPMDHPARVDAVAMYIKLVTERSVVNRLDFLLPKGDKLEEVPSPEIRFGAGRK